MQNIIITGASGFVGQNLSAYLESNGFDVASLSLRENNWHSKFDPDAQAVIHLAGKAHDTKNASDAEEYFTINTELTKALFDAFLKSNIKDFFYFSSVKAAADTVEGILDENVVPNPQTPYGQSKLKAEEYMLSARLPEDKRMFIIRPCMIHGPGNKGNLNLLFSVVKKGIPYPLAAYRNKRSFLSIDNLNFAIAQMLENDIPSGVYQFADDEALSTNDLIVLIGQSLSKKISLWNVPRVIINTLARTGDVFKLPLNSERLKKLTENYIVSNTKIVTAIGKPFPVSAKDGLIKTFNSFK
ncbi:NAD-dependent epimerase/dehydratase family protein [Flavobacterium sp. DG1-102-2]|uniref:NAD-dependent epimerase/dehydratase family protein n=1 Tax=Flavobacterium sp. DG1-102-2 TaxID=3081663 RepID=UPI00294A36F3|nr:NAD-dependent epimerase/dehydratase family protein [Flavobacterium sp. DG1-102-2]MDV6168397.1 NAD-dependent epimerase/dehydratase family protein [Flavobacterium sp. DG1-102-2]